MTDFSDWESIKSITAYYTTPTGKARTKVFTDATRYCAWEKRVEARGTEITGLDTEGVLKSVRPSYDELVASLREARDYIDCTRDDDFEAERLSVRIGAVIEQAEA